VSLRFRQEPLRTWLALIRIGGGIAERRLVCHEWTSRAPTDIAGCVRSRFRRMLSLSSSCREPGKISAALAEREETPRGFPSFWPARLYKEDQSILIAGCGTSQAAKHALRWPAALVIGIDVSETSVQCTQELKRKHNIDNMQVRRLPVERVHR
jgi:SAM-dependent methyltransferase